MTNNLNYWEILIRQNSTTAEEINKRRWDFVKELKAKTVLDYGSGPGWFRCFKPKGIKVDTFDIENWPQTGITRTKYDLIVLWDCLEHLKSTGEIEHVLNFSKRIALTVPIMPDPSFDSTVTSGEAITVIRQPFNFKKWQHFKPGEHAFYYTEDTLKALFANYGYEPIKTGYPECPPRNNIFSIILERKGRLYKWRV